MLLVAGRSVGLRAQRFQWPRVVGELAAGVLIERSVSGHLFPDLVDRLFHTGTVPSVLLQSLAWVGTLLLLVSGVRADLDLLRRIRRPSGATSSRLGPGGLGIEWLFENAEQTVIGLVFPPNDEDR